MKEYEAFPMPKKIKNYFNWYHNIIELIRIYSMQITECTFKFYLKSDVIQSRGKLKIMRR